MGWDVLIFKLKDSTTRAMEMDETKVLLLGGPEFLRAAIGEAFPAVAWTEPTWGVLRLPECTIEFSIKSEDDVCMGVHVHGGGDPVTPIVGLCKLNGWAALDTTTAEFIDLESPSHQGWTKFQAFRDRAIERLTGKKRPQ